MMMIIDDDVPAYSMHSVLQNITFIFHLIFTRNSVKEIMQVNYSFSDEQVNPKGYDLLSIIPALEKLGEWRRGGGLSPGLIIHPEFSPFSHTPRLLEK